MRRGLIAWDPRELPSETLRQRVQRLRSGMTGAGCDAVILYTNFIRCAAVSWLTGFTPYWADGILVVGAEGEPFFATSLSKRMGSWIETVMSNASVVTSPSPGKIAGNRLAQSGARRIGILELNDFPVGLHADLAAAMPDAAFVDASDFFAAARAPADEAELRLLQRAARMAENAFGEIDSPFPVSAGDAVAAIEKSARSDGAEEIYIAVAADLDVSRRYLRLCGSSPLGGRFALRASVAYKGSWIRCARTFARDGHDQTIISRAEDWFSGLPGIPADFHSDTVARAVAKLPGATLEDWSVEAPVGTRPLAMVASGRRAGVARLPASLTIGLVIGGMPWRGAGFCCRQ